MLPYKRYSNKKEKRYGERKQRRKKPKDVLRGVNLMNYGK